MRLCGGCAWLNLPYRKQLARKQTIVEELLAPLAGRQPSPFIVDTVRGMGANAGDSGRAAAPRGFRHKAATPFAPGPGGRVRAGFYASGSHRIVPVGGCPVEAPGARDILNRVARAAEACRIPAYHEDTRRGLLRYAIVRLGWRTADGMLTVVSSQRDLPRQDEFAHMLMDIDPRIVTVALNVNGKPTNAMLGSETFVLSGTGSMRDRLLDCVFEISPTAFYQTNPQQTEVLYRLAIEGMDLHDGDVLLDAYCGSGTIGLCAAAAAKKTGVTVQCIGVERNPAGIADARRNAQLNGLSAQAEFVEGDATSWMRHAAEAGTRIDVLSIDPPRAGATQAFLESAAALAPRRIVYVSCNPETQVRDIDYLLSRGYRLERVVPVDMFPHTEHIETVAWLSRA